MKILLLIVPALLFIMVPTVAESGTIEVTADIPSVPVYLDMVYAGVTPLTLSDIDAGNHLIQVSPEGFFSQTQNISVKSGEKSTISFSFVYSDRLQIPAMVRIGECVGTPEPSDLDGTSFDLLTLDDGTMMAYYSGWEEGILCMESSDGIHWDKKTDECLSVPLKGTVFRTEPWVFSLPDGSYRMVYRQTSGNQHSLYSASSPDGVMFSGEEPITVQSEQKSGSPDYPSVPAGIMYADGTIRIYYHNPGIGIQSAISEDMGVSWEHEDGTRLKYGTDPTVLLLPDEKTGIFYVDTTPKSKGQRIFFTVSDDGLDFSQYEPVQVLETTEPGVWLMDPEIIEEDGTVYLYFSVMGIEGMQNHVLPGTLRSIISLDCMVSQALVK